MDNELEMSPAAPTPMPAWDVTTLVPEAEDEHKDEGEDATRDSDALRLLLELEGEEYRLDEATNAYDALTHLRTARQSHIAVPD